MKTESGRMNMEMARTARASLKGFPLAVLLFAAVVQWSRGEPPTFTWLGDPSEQVQLQEHGRDLLTFQIASKSLNGKYSRANYVHPLLDPSGSVITEDFPEDHPHHRGVFWTWHQLLLNGKPVADPWMCQDIEWKAPPGPGNSVITQANSTKATLRVVRDWVVPDPQLEGQKLRLVRETTSITVWPTLPNLRVIDFDLRFRALTDGVSLGGSNDAKGYGGFSPRIHLANDVKFIGESGEVKPQVTAVEGGAWVDVIGTLDGARKGVLMMVHPSHPGFPLKWILRSSRSMQNPQWPGRKPVPLSTTIETRLRYRLTLHVGDLDRPQLERLWRDYAETD